MWSSLFDNGQGYYKPWATRTPVLAVLLFATSILIYLAELACNAIPAHNGYGEYGDLANNTLRLDATNLNATQSVLAAPSSPLLSSTPSQTPSSSTRRRTHLNVTASRTHASHARPTRATDVSSVIPTLHPDIFDYLSPQSSSTPGPQLISLYSNLGGGTTTSSESGGPFPQAAVATSPSATVLSMTFPVLQETGSPTAKPPPSITTLGPILVVDSSGKTLFFTPTALPGEATGASAFITLVGGKTFIESPDGIKTGASGDTLSNFTVFGGKTFTEAPAPVITIINGQTYSALETPILTVISGQTFTEIAAAVPAVSHAIAFEKTKTAIIPVATIVNLTGTFFHWSNGQSTIAPDMTLQQYVLVSFVPLILATLYTIPWKILDNTVREMEPFYQLSQPGGATAENSLCLDYATSILLTTPFKALRRGHFIVLWSSLISLVVLFVPSLASEAVFVSVTGTCFPHNKTCHSAWAVYPRLIRAIQALLSLIAVLLLFMIVYGYRRKSGVYSDPLSIAGLVSLLSNPPVLQTFRQIDSTTKKQNLQRLLAGKRFAISKFSELGQSPCYGIIELESPESPPANTDKRLARKKGIFKRLNTPDSNWPSDFDTAAGEDGSTPKLQKSRVLGKVKIKLYYCLAIVFLGGVVVLIAFYALTVANSGFEKWMDSGTYGLRFTWTGLGTAIKLFWNHLDQDLRRNEPYYRLLLGSSQPADSILVPAYMSPFSAIIPSLRRRHFIVSLVCFASVLAEFLPIFLGNIPYSPSLTWRAYITCSFLAILILLFMMACVAVLILRPRRSVRPLPRRTDTLASICCYVAADESGEGGAMGILDKLSGLSKMGTRERDNIVVETGGEYTMGIVKGGELRIDFDERITRLWSD